jgi:hypothetical protein
MKQGREAARSKDGAAFCVQSRNPSGRRRAEGFFLGTAMEWFQLPTHFGQLACTQLKSALTSGS